MRVITGKARGMRLESFEGKDIRPTTDKVKEAIFSSVQFLIEGSIVLDLFSGTGQMGIESLSRGADFAVFVDSDKNSIALTKRNLNKTKFDGNKYSKVIYEDSIVYLINSSDKFDFVFIDPPYRKGLIEKSFEHIENVLNNEAYIFCEHEKELSLPEKTVNNLIKTKDYKYGKIIVSLYRYFKE